MKQYKMRQRVRPECGKGDKECPRSVPKRVADMNHCRAFPNARKCHFCEWDQNCDIQKGVYSNGK